MTVGSLEEVIHNEGGEKTTMTEAIQQRVTQGGAANIGAAPTGRTAASKLSSEISLPVGTSDDGEIVFAHVRFDSGIKRNLIASLRALLEAMEKTLP